VADNTCSDGLKRPVVKLDFDASAWEARRSRSPWTEPAPSFPATREGTAPQRLGRREAPWVFLDKPGDPRPLYVIDPRPVEAPAELKQEVRRTPVWACVGFWILGIFGLALMLFGILSRGDE